MLRNFACTEHLAERYSTRVLATSVPTRRVNVICCIAVPPFLFNVPLNLRFGIRLYWTAYYKGVLEENDTGHATPRHATKVLWLRYVLLMMYDDDQFV